MSDERMNLDPDDDTPDEQDVRLPHEHNEPDGTDGEGVRDVPAVQAGQSRGDHSGIEAAPGGEPEASQPPLPEVDNVHEVQQLRALIRRESTALWSGPLPDPSTLQSYEDIVPGAADRILKVYESQTVQVSDREDRITQAQTRRDFNGQTWAMILSAICVIGAIIFGALRNVPMASLLLGMPAIMLIGSFIPTVMKKSKSDEDDDHS